MFIDLIKIMLNKIFIDNIEKIYLNKQMKIEQGRAEQCGYGCNQHP